MCKSEIEVFYWNKMAKKRNRGKKSTGTKPSSAAVSENQSQPSSIADKINAVKTNVPVEIASASIIKSENSNGVSSSAGEKDGCGLLVSANKVWSSKDFLYSYTCMQYWASLKKKLHCHSIKVSYFCWNENV